MSRIRAVTTIAVIAYVICMILPEMWTEKLHIGEIPLSSLILACIACLVFVQLFGTPDAISRRLLGGVVALVLMAVCGYVRGNIDTYTLKFFVADVYFFTAFLVGLAFGATRRKEELARIVKWISGIATAGIVLTYIALFTGLLAPSSVVPADRQVTGSIFVATSVLLIVLPWASVTSSRVDRSQSELKLFVVLGTSAATALLSGTRSLFLLVLFVTTLCWALKPQRLKLRFFVQLLLGLAMAAVLLVSGLPIFETVLFERIATHGIVDETRSMEVSMLWDQLSNDVIWGQGMGSRFISDVVIDGDPLASAPHIGILTFLMKGGVLAFAVYALAPALGALLVFFSSRSLNTQRGAAASILVFIALACMSGGWGPLLLFAYGLAISAAAGDVPRRLPPPAFRATPIKAPA
jgi:hypothetical protein